MKKKWILLILIPVAVLTFLLARTVATKLVNNYIQSSYEETAEADLSDPGEEEVFLWNEQAAIEPSEKPTYWALTELAVEYNNKIPFVNGGRYGRTGYPVTEDGVDNRYHPEGSAAGMDSLGYIMWLYRNLFGSYDPRLEDPAAMHTEASVDLSDLKIGDVGMISLEKEGNHYGICIGFLNDLAVFSHCDSAPHALYPGGVNRLTYLSLQTDQYLEGQAPENFQYFIRPDAEWESNIYE